LDLLNNQDSKLGNGAFEVVKDIAAEKAKQQRDDIIRFLGSDVVDSFKARMCVSVDITQTDLEILSVKYTPSPLRYDHPSDEGMATSMLDIDVGG